ncbi:hypothetical protein [Furfurilactobacillus siliginis]|uniref:Uncharacterized protein n=1 Tax=Furfurilactobacillus siliginis TaxID=348151 RepID=A0A0R2L7N7_9LACO|nr:hypothetical protein [Furfurilactobacillus siliginis]KRN95404.1 hypothetical protein IV55_GL002048 [Furfurilactobacillus siliginis]GEK28184.1 hypothetical protein LSI01_04950 [Furfurilactobacillus siliginis]
MRLVDFNFSTADYDRTRPLFILADPKPLPVTELRQQADTHQLILVTSTGRPLTLDQFAMRTQKIPGSWRIVTTHTTPRELFGYRLVDEKVVFM